MIIKGTTLRIVCGDILKQPVEAIVNAANSFLEGGGGIDGAIHRAAGPQLVEACRRYKKEHGIFKIEVGEAILTESYEIKKSNPHILYIIHTVGPNCAVASQNGERKKLLNMAYQNSLARAHEKHVTSIAFPAISTGIYSYPFEEAQIVALKAIEAYLEKYPGHFKDVLLTYFSQSDFQTAKTIWSKEMDA